jgi:tRNA uridine 5-carbamoylmethylation protein Kti12
MIYWFTGQPGHGKTVLATALKQELDIDKHRWYETGVSVWKLNEGFLGVRSVTNIYSESSSVEDMFWNLIFFEMEEIQTITYKKK